MSDEKLVRVEERWHIGPDGKPDFHEVRTMSDEKPSFSEEIGRLVDERVRTVMANREAYVAAWMAETGLRPSECELVEQHHADGRLTVTVERREGPAMDAPAMLELLRAAEKRFPLTCPETADCWFLQNGTHSDDCFSGKLGALLDKHGRG